MSRKPSFYEVCAKTGMLRSLLATKADPDMMMEGDVEYPLARIEPWNDLRRRLARKCNAILKANNVKVTHKRGRDMIHMFYVGAMCALDDEANAWVLINLLSGRFDDLLKED